MTNQNNNRSIEIELLRKEQLLITEKLDILTTLFDDISKMYFELEEDLFQSGKIKKKHSDDGFKYNILSDK